jgi:hypothetical protein
MRRETTCPAKSSLILATALVLVLGLPGAGTAEPCAQSVPSTAAAPLHRPACADAKVGYPPAGVTREDLLIEGIEGGMDDVAGAEINTRDAMVKSSLATPGTLTSFSALGSGGTGPNGSLVQGCDFDAGGGFGTLYCIEGSGGFFTVDTTTGAQALIGVAAVEAPDAVRTGLASDPTTGVMYMVATSESSPGSGDCASNSGLYTIDLGTGASTRIGTIPSLSCVIAAGFDNSGQLYAYGVVSDSLVSIDKATGASTVVGPLGFNANFAQGMDFDGATNTCYLFAFNDDNSFGFEGELRTCDTQTGATALVGGLGSPGDFSEVSGAGIAHLIALFVDGFESGDASAWTSVSQ